jgi:hypothetical protein
MNSYCLTDQAMETQRLIYTSKRGKTREGLGEIWMPISHKSRFGFFSHKMKNVNRYSHQWIIEYQNPHLYVFIRNIAIKFNTRLFGKHPWDFVFIIQNV